MDDTQPNSETNTVFDDTIKHRKSLSGRIFAVVFTLSLVVMLVATLAATTVSYSEYESQAEQILLSQASKLADSLKSLNEQEMCKQLEEISLFGTRCTLVAADGTVLYDNYADASQMDNHASREEISAARVGNSATLTRYSNTLDIDTIYAASEVHDGIVVRLAETRTSLASYVSGMWWQLVIALIAIVLLSLLFSRLLTRMVVKPLCEIDLQQPLNNDAYEELQPLLQRVDMQRQELKQQNKQLEIAVNMRREFTSNVSHDMKTPLQVIGGYAELIANGMVSQEDVPRFAGLIRGEAENMRNLIDDVLVLSRLDENATGELQPVCLADICHIVVARLNTEAADKQIDIHMQLDEKLHVNADPMLCEQMIYNLVNNAIKYNDDGGAVLIKVRKDAEDALIIVADSGRGIAPELRERVFERFFRADSSRSREDGSTGLGLAIVKHAVELFGGSVIATDSDLGGAQFEVRIPMVV